MSSGHHGAIIASQNKKSFALAGGTSEVEIIVSLLSFTPMSGVGHICSAFEDFLISDVFQVF